MVLVWRWSSPLVCNLCQVRIREPNAGVAVRVDAHLGCFDDVGEDQVSLYWYDWLRRQACRCQMWEKNTCLNPAFPKPAKYYLPVRPSKFLFPFGFKNYIIREIGLCCGLKLIKFELRLWILGKLLPVALERTWCDFFCLNSSIFWGGKVGRSLGTAYTGN